jgi:nitric oxide reductase large subunit
LPKNNIAPYFTTCNTKTVLKQGFAPIFILVIILVLGGIGLFTYFLSPFPIPPNILNKYQEIDKTYSTLFGTKLSYCRNGLQVIYVLGGNGGFTGVNYYYDRFGKELFYEKFGDVKSYKDSQVHPPNLKEYSCSLAK